jgi:hypothetical protein
MFNFMDAGDYTTGPSPYDSWYFCIFYVIFIMIGNIL